MDNKLIKFIRKHEDGLIKIGIGVSILGGVTLSFLCGFYFGGKGGLDYINQYGLEAFKKLWS